MPQSPAPVSDQRWDPIPGHSQRCDRKRSGDVGVFLPESASSSPRDGTGHCGAANRPHLSRHGGVSVTPSQLHQRLLSTLLSHSILWLTLWPDTFWIKTKPPTQCLSTLCGCYLWRNCLELPFGYHWSCWEASRALHGERHPGTLGFFLTPSLKVKLDKSPWKKEFFLAGLAQCWLLHFLPPEELSRGSQASGKDV